MGSTQDWNPHAAAVPGVKVSVTVRVIGNAVTVEIVSDTVTDVAETEVALRVALTSIAPENLGT